jgi:hypothetical protein
MVSGDLARPDLTERLAQDADRDWLVLLLIVEVPGVGDMSDDPERSAEAVEPRPALPLMRYYRLP